MASADAKVGEGEEYEMVVATRVLPRNVVEWRREQFEKQLGFSKAVAEVMADLADVDLNTVRRWVALGVPHAEIEAGLL